MEEEEYVLSKALLSDGEPVRSLCYVDEDDNVEDTGELGGTLYAGSQGALITKFPLQPSSQPPSEDGAGGGGGMEMFHSSHSHQVTALVAIPTTMTTKPNSLKGGYVSGCKDHHIRIFDSSSQLVRTLTGHDNAVTSLSWVVFNGGGDNNNGDGLHNHVVLASGSWDGTCRLWNIETGLCIATLGGHENTVCVCGLPPPPPHSSAAGCLVTGSAGVAQDGQIVNHKIRFWDLEVDEGSGGNGGITSIKGEIRHTIMDHGGPVRGLCLDPQTKLLASCSNDGTVKIRNSTTGECYQTLTHPCDSTPPLVLNVAAIGSSKFVSVTEDGTAVVWTVDLDGGSGSSGTKKQVIYHPNCVWTILGGLPNGDFVTGCHDGFARVFTASPTRQASPTEIATFHDAVTEAMAKKSSGGGPSAEEISKLTPWENHAFTPGTSEGQVMVFNKSGKAIAAQWSVASGTWIEVGEVTGSNENAGTIEGVAYDHVFPIEIDVQGGGVRTLQIGYNTGDNPFVTAQGFIDQHELDQNYLGQIADYIRQRSGQAAAAPTLGMESGSGAGSGGGFAGSGMPPATTARTIPPAGPATPVYQYLPMQSYLTFDAGIDKKGLTKIQTKIQQFNDDHGASSSSSTSKLSPTELTSLDDLVKTLGATSRYHATSVTNAELNVLGKILATWSTDVCFPALDLCRGAVLHPDASSTKRVAFWADVIRMAIEKCNEVHTSKPEGICAVAVPMLSFRLFANACKGSGSGDAIAGSLQSALECASQFVASDNKNIRLSVATFILNASALMKRSPTKQNATPAQILGITKSVLADYGDKYENEPVTRCLVAVGTVLLVGDEARMVGVSLDMAEVLRGFVASGGAKHGAKAVAVAQEVLSILG